MINFFDWMYRGSVLDMGRYFYAMGMKLLIEAAFGTDTQINKKGVFNNDR